MRFNKFHIAGLLVVVSVLGAYVLNRNNNQQLAELKNYQVIADAPVGTALVKLEPATANVKVGDTVNLDIIVDTAGEVAVGSDLLIEFPADKLEVVDADATKPGVQIAPGNVFEFVAANETAQTAGLITFSTAQQPTSRPISVANGKLASIPFKVKAGSGPAAVTIVFTPGDTTDTNVVSGKEETYGRDLLSKIQNATITIEK